MFPYVDIRKAIGPQWGASCESASCSSGHRWRVGGRRLRCACSAMHTNGLQKDKVQAIIANGATDSEAVRANSPGGNGVPPRGVDAEEPGGSGAPRDPDDLLVQAGAAKEQLPQDMQVRVLGVACCKCACLRRHLQALQI